MYQRADHGTKGKKADQPADNEEDNYDIQEVVHLSLFRLFRAEWACGVPYRQVSSLPAHSVHPASPNKSRPNSLRGEFTP